MAALRRGGEFLLAALRSEIQHELAAAPKPFAPLPFSALVEGFSPLADRPDSQDLLLRRRTDGRGGEEVVVSAVLAPLRWAAGDEPERDVLMKVCVKKLGRDPVLHFHCVVPERKRESPRHFAIRKAYYHGSLEDVEHVPTGYQFGSLNPELQKTFKEYLIARGVTPKLTSFLIEHLQAKEQSQYVTWLRTLAGVVARNESLPLPSDLQ